MQVLVDGVSTPLLVNSLSVDNAVGQRSTAGVTLRDDTGAQHYQDGQRIDIVADDGTLVYSGVIDSDDETMPDSAISSGLLYHNVACKDWHYLADKRLVATSYASGQTCAFVIGDLITNYLAAEGVTSIANWLSVNQSNVETNTTGFAAVGSGVTTLTRVTTEHQQGSAALQVTTDGTANPQGVKAVISGATYQANKSYTFSVYVKGASGTVQLRAVREDTSAILASSPSLTLAGSWQRLSVTATTPASVPSAGISLRVVTDSNEAITFYVDALQVELGTAARPWAVGQSTFIATGITLPDVVFNYATAAACLDAITQKAGNYWWQIDQYRQLWFQPYAAIAAPWALTSSGGVVADARYGTVKVKRQKPMYRNRQYIRGATGTTNTQTETRKGDGTTTTFTMSYPIAKVPAVTVNGVSKTVGIKGLDTGKDWYWSSGDPVLAQDSGGTKLISTDTLQVVYVGSYPIIIISEDTAQIIAQQTLEGGGTSGKVEDITEDTSLTTQDAAFLEAAALLAKYGQSATTLQFQTSRAGLAPGQLLTVTIPEHGFSAVQMLIQSVHISDEDGQIIWYDVTALLGPVNTTWVQFFGVLVSSAQAGSDVLNVGASSTLVIVANFTGTITPSGTHTATVIACPICSPTTLCGPSTIVC